MRDRFCRAPDERPLERSRRELLHCALVVVGTLRAAIPPARADEPEGSADRWIELRNIHTNEVVSARFRDAHGFVPEALTKLQHLLRDYRTGEEHEMDPRLYVQLSELARAAGVPPRYEVISGYRSPATNAMLHATGHKVSERSLHMQGRALDVRLRGCDLAALRDLALAAMRGGVGYYPRSNFIHIDTGRVRKWQEE
jgi:uncharacterized protein YcbK (DUF882 family)